MGRPDDLELELARRLEEDGELEVPESMLEELSTEELKEFQQAQECLAILKRVRRESTKSQHETLSDETADDDVPKQLGKFRIVHKLGFGGFGIVYLAHDQSLGRDVAIKIPRSQHLLVEEYRQRFEREAKAAAVLAHPAIVPVFESGCIDQLHYITFEFCDGVSLDKWLERTPTISPINAAQAIRHLADAVQHAHSRGVVHRDLKPGNVLLEGVVLPAPGELNGVEEAPFETRCLKIADFGLAKLASENESLTQQGAIVGTPAYMSPEQAKGEPEVGPAADIYSLGVILFQLLTGNPPFVHSKQIETLKAICDSEPTSPRKLNPEVAKDLSAICLKCLEKNPSDRYESTASLRDDLDRFIRQLPVSAREANAVEKTLRWFKRNPRIAGSIVTTILVLVAATITLTLMWLNMKSAWQTSEYHENQSRLQAQQALKQTQNLRDAVNELLTAIANEPSLKSKNMTGFRNRLLTAASRYLRQLQEDIPEDPQLLVEYLRAINSLAIIHEQLGDSQASLDICNDAIELIERKNEPGLLSIHLKILESLATSQLSTGQFSAAAASRQSALTLATEWSSSHPMLDWGNDILISALTETAAGLLSSKDFAGAKKYLDQATQLMEQSYGNVSEWPATHVAFQLLAKNADCCNRTGRTQKGIVMANRAVELFDDLPHSENRESTSNLHRLANLHFVLGVGHSNAGNHDFALQHFGDSAQTQQKLILRHPDVVDYVQGKIGSQLSIGLTHVLQRKWEESEKILSKIGTECEDAIQRFPQQALRFKFFRLKSFNMLQAVYRDSGRLKDARATLEQAMATCEQIKNDSQFSFEHQSEFAFTLNNLGRLDAKEARYQSSVDRFLEAIEILERLAKQQSNGEVIDRLVNALIGVVAGADQLNDFDRAIEYCDQLLDRLPPSDSRQLLFGRTSLKWLIADARFEKAHSRSEQLRRKVKNSPNRSEELFKIASSIASGFEIASKNNGADWQTTWKERFAGQIEGTINELVDAGVSKKELAERLTEAPEFSAIMDTLNKVESIPRSDRCP